MTVVKTSADEVTAINHGYSVADVHELAGRVVYRCRWRTVTFHDVYELAWSEIAEHLCACERAPSSLELLDVGERAVRRLVLEWMRDRGLHDRESRGQNGSMRRYWAYWWMASGPVPSPEGGVVDRLALEQIWPRLTRRNRELFEALAECGDYQSAAESVGLAYESFTTLICLARKQFFRLWHDGETPSGMWGNDQRVHLRREAPASYRRGVMRSVTRRLSKGPRGGRRRGGPDGLG